MTPPFAHTKSTKIASQTNAHKAVSKTRNQLVGAKNNSNHFYGMSTCIDEIRDVSDDTMNLSRRKPTLQAAVQGLNQTVLDANHNLNSNVADIDYFAGMWTISNKQSNKKTRKRVSHGLLKL